MTSKWTVDSYHFTVPTGDCGFHILLDGAKVQKVVLVDGGTYRVAVNMVTEGIKKLEALYGMVKGTFKIDTIVMSHWDEDHYGAMARKFQADVQDGIKKKKKPWEALTYLRWTDDNKPATLFYCPNEAEDGDMQNGLAKWFRRGIGDDTKPFIEVTTDKTPDRRKDKDWYPFAILKSTDSNMGDVLGVNFLTHKALASLKDVTPTSLVKDNPPDVKGQPGIYCIGVRNTGFAGPVADADADEDDDEDPADLPGIVPEGVTRTNQWSIAAVILWPDTDETLAPYCTHYFAGDADEKREAAYQTWLYKGGVIEMTNMKLSHHGSRSSTPINALAFSPMNIVMSNPKGSYFHPGWETVLFLAAWTRFDEDTQNRVSQIFGTRHPFILEVGSDSQYKIIVADRKRKPAKKMFKTLAFDDKAHGEALQTFLTDVYKQCQGWQALDGQPAGKSEVQVYDDTKDPNDGDVGKRTILSMVAARWQTFGWPPASLAAAATATGSAAKTTTTSIPMAVILRSGNPADPDSRNGDVGYLTAEQVAATAIARRVQAVAKKSTETLGKRAPTSELNVGQGDLAGWSGTPVKKRKTDQKPEADPELLSQPMQTEEAFYTQPGTNINEMDHEDWKVQDTGLDNKTTTLALRKGRLGGGGGSTSSTGTAGSNRMVRRTSKQHKLGDIADDTWYVYADTISEAAIVAVTSRYTRLTEDFDWNWFVSKLHCAMISLARNPLQDPASASVPLHGDDELGSWFRDVLNAQDVLMLANISGTPLSSIIGGFAISMVLSPMRPSVSMDDDDPIVLLFSTEASVLENAFAGSSPPKMGLRAGETAMVLGLDIQARKPGLVTLKTLASFVGLEQIFQGAFLSPLQNLSFVIPDPTRKGAGDRNALWFVPQNAYETTTRLQLDLADEWVAALGTFLRLLKGQATSAYVIARRKTTWTSSPKGINSVSEGMLALAVAMEIAKLKFEVIMDMTPSLVTLTLVLKEKTSTVLNTMLEWLQSTFMGDNGGEDPFPFTKWFAESASGISFPGLDFRRVTIAFTPPASKDESLKFSSFALDLEVSVAAKDQTILSLFTFKYSSAEGSGLSLEADLWFAPPYNVNDPARKLLPDNETYRWMEPLSVPPGEFEKWPKYLDLAKLSGFAADDSPPGIFPTAVTGARFFIDSSKVEVDGTLRSVASQEHSKPPIFSIDEIHLFASYNFDSSGFSINTALSALIQPPESSTDLVPAEIKGGFEYDGAEKKWSLFGSIEKLTAAHLYQFFQDDVRMASATLLESIAIKTFDIRYAYQTGQPSEFNLAATLGIGTIDFDLQYNNRGDAWDWDFYARVYFDPEKSQQSSFSDMLANVVGDSEVSIPTFLGNIDIKMTSSEDEIGVRLVPDKERQVIVFTMWVKLGPLRVQYIQFAHSGKEERAKADPPAVKRVFLTSIDALPKVEVPLLGDLTQPFDEALALWVQPQEGSDGLTLDEMDLINSVITSALLHQKALPYKAVMKDPGKTDVVLRNGVHLMLVLKDDRGKTNVALDYVFGDKKKEALAAGLKKNNKKKRLTARPGRVSMDDFPTENGESGMAEYSKSYGGFSVRNLGLKYASNTLSIKVDAEIKFGPIDFAVFGFALHLEFTPGQPFSLFSLPKPSVSLEGLMAVYNKAPLTLGGLLLHTSDELMEMYQGALVAGWTPWMFSAAGCYGEIKGLDAYKTFFVYARLLGPLITLEFATIEGVTAGFGYNNSMKFPTVADITSYPLISVPAPSNPGPQAALQALTGTKWFAPKKDSFWIAAGLDVSAFEMLDISAVLAVEWDPSVKLGIFAIATADIPKQAVGGLRFAHVQLGLTAVLDLGAGTFKVDGQLTPSSYVLDPNCHLTGGFALYTWFGDAVPELKGDFVFTLGGYHRQFVPPAQYPRPPRLAISWKFDSAISIRGEAYFAITPKVCMGGGRWDVSLVLGPLEAYYAAFIDFLISFKPFYFIADGGISVGVKFTLDLWLVTIRISVDIGARLHVEGPPIWGTVHVDFWVFGFDVDFGNRQTSDKALTLDEFITLACQSKDVLKKDALHATIGRDTPVGHRRAEDEERRSTGRIGDKAESALVAAAHTEAEAEADDPRKPHVLVVQSGLVPDGGNTVSTPSGGLWAVRAANFSFAVSCKVAVRKATIITGVPDGPDEHESVVNGTGNPIYARPMCDANQLTSTELQVRITPVKPARKMLAAGEEKLDVTVPVWDNNVAILKSLPSGLWGKYDPSKDPRSHANDPSYLNGTSEGTVSLMCGVVITVPKPASSDGDKTHPFDYRKFMVQEIDPPPAFYFPALPANEARFLPAKPSQPTLAWEEVRQAWNKPGYGPNAGAEAVKTWCEVGLTEMGWDPAKVDGGKGNAMTGQTPEVLVKGLEAYYLWAPYNSVLDG